VSHAYDPELAAVIPALPVPDLSDIPALRTLIDERVAAATAARPVDTTGVEVRDLELPGVRDAAPVKVRTYAAHDRPRPSGAILELHGGGYVIGSLAITHDQNLRLARETGVLIVAVDYRLAPEHPYPAALHDCHAALCWLAERAEALAVDRERIAVRGVSAGAGLAAALALLLRDEGGPALCFQFLVTPALDDRQRTESVRRFGDTPLWTTQNARDGWDAYLGAGRAGAGDVPVYAAPARATDLAGLPPAYVSVMEFDPLRDEGIAYAQQLLAAGVQVELHLFPGTFHGSVSIAKAQVSQRERAEEVAVLRRALGDAPR